MEKEKAPSDAAAKVLDSLSTYPGGVPAEPKSTHPSVWSVLGEPQPETPRPRPPPRDAWGDELAAASGGLGFDEADFDATRAAADGAPVRSLPPVRSLSDGALARFDSGSAPAAGPDRLPAPLPRKPRRSTTDTAPSAGAPPELAGASPGPQPRGRAEPHVDLAPCSKVWGLACSRDVRSRDAEPVPRRVHLSPLSTSNHPPLFPLFARRSCSGSARWTRRPSRSP